MKKFFTAKAEPLPFPLITFSNRAKGYTEIKLFCAVTCLITVLLLLSGCKNAAEVQSGTVTETFSETSLETSAQTEISAETVTETSAETVTTTETSAEETTTEKFEYPEPILPPEAVKIDIDIDSDKKYTVQTEILDEENILVIYEFRDKNYGITAAEAKIFGISDGEEKLHIEMPKGKVDGYLTKDALWSRKYRTDDENVYFAIYGYKRDGDSEIDWGKSETVVYNDYTYKTQKYTNGVSYYPRLIDIGGKHIVRETAHSNFYDCESNEIILNSIFEGYDSKSGVSYSYEFSIDGDRFVYSMWGYEWSWGFGIYDFTTGTARDVPGVGDHRPMGYHDGKIYSCYCEHDGFTDNILYVTDVNTLETTPFHEFYHGDREFIDPFTDYDNYDYVYDYKMTPNGKFLMNTDEDGDVFKVILYSIDTLEAVREYEFKNTYICEWGIRFTEDGKAVLTDDKQKCLYVLDLNK